MVGWLCLFGGVFGLWLPLNALWPRRGWLLAPSFAAAVLTAELGAITAAVALGFGVLFYLAGAGATLPGQVGLALHAGAVVAGIAVEVRALAAARPALDAVTSLGDVTVPGRLAWRSRPWALSHRGVERLEDLSYGPAVARNTADVWRPRGATTPRPVLLQIHGGGWVVGSKRVQARPLMMHLAAAGWVCVPITYRLSPRATFPAHLDDCRLAVRWVREHIAEYGGDPSRIVVTGGSAGGHLAALTALHERGLAGCAPFYAPFDLADLFQGFSDNAAGRWVCRSVFGCRTDAREALLEASPISFVHPDAPPFLVTQGTADTIVPVEQARRFVEALRKVSKQPVLYAELPGAGHAFDLWRGARTAAVVAAVHRFAEWAVSRVPSPQAADS